MGRRFLVFGLYGLLVLGVVAGGAAAPPITAGWGSALEVPGSGTLNSGGIANVRAISCAAVGECAAGGRYTDGSGDTQAFVVGETNGHWGTAIEVPGTAALNSGGNAWVNSVSCGAAGDCATAGYYIDGSGNSQAFVASETSGSWGTAIEVPGTATLNSTGDARANSVSCGAAGDCAAGGYYRDGSGHYQVFVVDETNGSWSDAVEVPGTATLNSGGDATLNAVSCAAAENCTAGGFYIDGSAHVQAFVVNETSGSWSDAIAVPGAETLNSGHSAAVRSVSCAAVGDCAAGGYYTDGTGHAQAFVVGETNGGWGNAVEVPGTATLNSGGEAWVNSVSCSTAGNCAAGGYYTDGSSSVQAFVVKETHGSWGTAIEVPGTATLNSGGNAEVSSVSCGAAGDCTAGGYYTDSSVHVQAFVTSETKGSWLTAIEVPGTATLNIGGNAVVNAVSCAAAGHCSAGGIYGDGSAHFQAFVVSSTSPCVVPKLVGKTLTAAKKTLSAASCGVGKIRKVYANVKKGRVVAQHPKSGTYLKHGAKVALTLSKGRR